MFDSFRHGRASEGCDGVVRRRPCRLRPSRITIIARHLATQRAEQRARSSCSSPRPPTAHQHRFAAADTPFGWRAHHRHVAVDGVDRCPRVDGS
jgi:hypothetical protein